MNICERCGVETVNAGWCDDCLEVEGGERRRGHKFSEAKRDAIYAQMREYRAMGIPVREIAEHYRVNRSTVEYALRAGVAA